LSVAAVSTGLYSEHMTPMSTEQQLHTLLTAQRFGGNFMRLLATAGLAADPQNKQRLFEAFPELENFYGPRTMFYSESLG